METKKLTAEQIEMLRKPLPKEAVSKHPTKTYLSSIKAIYVVERLNQVFGIGTWKQKSREVTSNGKMVVVQSNLQIPEYGIELEAYGGNDNADMGDAYKGAATDALTKMASMLEIGMDVFKGLADKPQDNIPANGTPPAPSKPELLPSMSAWKKAVEHIAKGGTVDQVKKTYSITPQIEKELLSEAKTYA